MPGDKAPATNPPVDNAAGHSPRQHHGTGLFYRSEESLLCDLAKTNTDVQKRARTMMERASASASKMAGQARRAGFNVPLVPRISMKSRTTNQPFAKARINTTPRAASMPPLVAAMKAPLSGRRTRRTNVRVREGSRSDIAGLRQDKGQETSPAIRGR